MEWTGFIKGKLWSIIIIIIIIKEIKLFKGKLIVIVNIYRYWKNFCKSV